jgi:hypothetical protein
MNVRDLIEELEGYPEDMEVRLATQPSWPFEWTLDGVTTKAEALGSRVAPVPKDLEEDYGGAWALLDDEGEVEEAFATREEAEAKADKLEEQEGPDCVYLLEGSQLGYTTARLWGEV